MYYKKILILLRKFTVYQHNLENTIKTLSSTNTVGISETIKKNKRTSLMAQWLRICFLDGFEQPWSGKIPHAAEQLSLYATTTEPAHCNY